MSEWIRVEDDLPEPGVIVIGSGVGWSNTRFSCACYYDEEREGWWEANTHWTDAHEGRIYPDYWTQMPTMPHPATIPP